MGTENAIGERNLNNPANETVLDGHGIATRIVLATGATAVVLDGVSGGFRTGPATAVVLFAAENFDRNNY